MKKILTLLVMFLATWSVLCAQTPVFGYQAVVRTADNELVENTPVMVTITVLNGDVVAYSEKHSNITTDGLGMVSLLVGAGTDVEGNIQEVDWSKAEIRTEFQIDGGETVEVVTEVAPAPYAFAAYKKILTTDRIVHYVESDDTRIGDYAVCMEALGENVPEQGQMWEKTRNRIINYIKNHRDLALQVAVHYLETTDQDEVNEIYGYLTPEAKQEAINVGIDFLVHHRGFVMEVLAAYLATATTNEVDDFVDAVLTHESDIVPYVVDFAKDNRKLALKLANAFLASANAQEVTSALGVFENSPMKQKFINEFFYNHLDNILHPNVTVSDDAIKNAVNAKCNGYLKKDPDCPDVDICDMRDEIESILGD